MSSSWGEVKGWWAAIHCFSDSSHSNMGKLVNQRKRNLRAEKVGGGRRTFGPGLALAGRLRRRRLARLALLCGGPAWRFAVRLGLSRLPGRSGLHLRLLLFL